MIVSMHVEHAFEDLPDVLGVRYPQLRYYFDALAQPNVALFAAGVFLMMQGGGPGVH